MLSRVAFAGKADKPTRETNWNWVLGIPLSTKRAEAVPATIHLQLAAQLIPSVDASSVRLASSNPATDLCYNIVEVNGHPINHLQDFIANTEELDDEATVRIQEETSSEQHELVIPRDKMTALRHLTGYDSETLRLTNDGRTRALIRGSAASCELSARVERNHGILLLDVSIESVRGGSTLIPAEVTASCDGNSLRCLTASQTLDLLYGQLGSGAGSSSFATVSEREDYLATTNFRQLEQSVGQRVADQPPALVSLPGIEFPGSPILGDARALSGYLLQGQIIRNPGERRNGWIVFAGGALRSAAEVTVTVDLGDGERILTMVLPN